jgi:hypothetical protein
VRAYVNAIIQTPFGKIGLKSWRRGATKVVVVLDDGGKVVIVRVLEVAAPFDRLRGPAGLNEQVEPAICSLHDRATEVGMLFVGVTMNWVEPDWPAVTVRLGAAVPRVKSPWTTLIKM